MSFFHLALLAALSLASACGSTHQLVSSAHVVGIQLGESVADDGSKSEWRLHDQGRGTPRLDRIRSFVEVVPRVGLRVSLVTRKRAEELRVEPWKGVVVESVALKSPADLAGIENGDIILEVGGTPVASPEQFTDAIQQRAVVGQPLDFKLLVFRRGEDTEGGGSAIVSITPAAHEVRQSNTDSFELETSRGIRHYTGMQLGEVPPSLARTVFDEDRSVVMVTSVRSGSPAYLAGFRAGDIVVECDGVAVGSLVDVRRATLGLIRQAGFGGPLYELGELEPMGADGEATMLLKVRGALGPHTAELSVNEDITDSADFYMPILLDYESDVESADVEFLDFIFQWGFSYVSCVRPSATREPVETWELSLLPLGLIEVERTLSDTEYRVLWFIRW